MTSKQTNPSFKISDGYEPFVKLDCGTSTYVKSLPSVDENESYVKKQLKIAFCLNLGHVLIGYTISWSAPMIPKLQNLEESPVGRVITDVEASWIATIFLPTNLIVLNVAGFVANIVGRKPYLIFSSSMMCCGYVFLATATNLNTIYIGRILAGAGMGSIAIINVIYIGEIASPKIRGIIMAMTSISHALGSLLVYSVGPFVSYATVEYVGLIIGIVYTGCGFYIPESPVYYAIRGNIEAAKNTLRQLGRSRDIETELKTMITDLEGRNKSLTQSWREIFTEKINRKSLCITGILFMLQEGCGAVTVVFFATNIFKNANSSIEPHIGTIILGVVELLGVLCTPFLIERSGRKILLYISTLLCGLTMASLGLYFYFDLVKQGAFALSLGWVPLMLLIIFLLSYSCGLSIIPHVISGEVFTPPIRSTGSSLAFTFGLVSCFVTNLGFGYMTSLGNHIIFWTLASVNIAAFVFTAACVPETKGKSLTEIQNMLAN